MSAKWHRSRAWDERHLVGALRPVKHVLRAFSSIPLAVALLSLVALYGVLASVPIGLIAMIPTWCIHGVVLVACVGVLAGLPAWGVRKALRSPGARIAGVVLTLVVLAPCAVWLWAAYVWPAVRYDPSNGRGLLLFADFVNANRAVTMRRLPGMEMSELEFYGWWPLRVVLMLFVLNLAVATVRRIEFEFKNLGVLTVHTGIITIALGSVYYAGLKKEGDTLLVAGALDPATGKPGLGPPQRAFFDNTRLSLFVNQDDGWEQRPLEGVPRYNDYNLAAITGESAWDLSGRARPWAGGARRGLDVPVEGSTLGRVSPNVSLRLVGYAAYAEPVDDFVRVDPREGMSAGAGLNPLRIVYLYSDHEDLEGRTSAEPAYAFHLSPRTPSERVSANEVFSIEYTLGMPEARWRALGEALPEGATHGLVIEVPGEEGREGFRAVYAARPGQEIAVGGTGWRARVKSIAPEPPFPIITPGYEGATSAVAVVTLTGPGGETFDRWVYHRFPEIAQDMLAELNERGMPRRRDADPRISLTLIEADHLAVYLDESGGRTRAIVRTPRGPVAVHEALGDDGWVREIVPQIHLRVGARWEHAERVQRPRPTPAASQDKSLVGTHEKGMLAVEVSWKHDGAPLDAAASFRRIVWLPFARYAGASADAERRVMLPDGSRLTMVFGRRQHAFPGFDIRLADFEMIAYDHRGAPRDYQSLIRVSPVGAGDFEPFEHVTRLNNPLRAPARWDDDRWWITNVALRLASGLSPNQYKLSQAGWDAKGWERTRALADEGKLARPFAQFTILGVGNNPGIHIVALGGVLMGVGIPWAFYVKPWLVRREKKRIQEQVASGTYRRPGGAVTVIGLNGTGGAVAANSHAEEAS